MLLLGLTNTAGRIMNLLSEIFEERTEKSVVVHLDVFLVCEEQESNSFSTRES